MREIRIRVWDRRYGRMIPPSDVCICFIYFHPRGEAHPYLFDRTKNRWKSIELCDVMHSTFKCDGDGKEIFEGDLIQTAEGMAVASLSPNKYRWLYQYAVTRPEIDPSLIGRFLTIGTTSRIRKHHWICEVDFDLGRN